ncbi:MlaD family protein [Patulibacter defluvii]|uniref:MlaD family protein n=1 Tax=Patulibacter defluvii TaxID=3095358 RepID=UPI002A759283|nr:MlaD family protein [Patulibacter sp. DM4]
MARVTTSTRRRIRRGAAVALLVAVVVAVALLVAGGGDDGYRVHARFVNAGQMVEGATVQVAGRRVGTVTRLTLADDGTADAELSLDDRVVRPLRRDARAAIRAVGQAGVASRFVDLTPGSSRAPAIADGGTLPLAQTRGIVDLDAILDRLDAPARRDVRGLIRGASRIYAGSSAASFNRMLARLDPALGETARLFGELEADGDDVERLIVRAGDAASAIAARRQDLRRAVSGTARALGAVAERRTALDGVLRRAPAVLRMARGTLAGVSVTTARLRPALRLVPAAAAPLGQVARALPPTLARATPVVGRLRRDLPAVRRTLLALPALRPSAVEALGRTRTALAAATPILRGVRYYGSDFILGVLNGLAGVAVGNYNELGHYARLEFVQNVQTLLGGALSSLVPALTGGGLLGPINVRTHLDARCPGSTAPPAPDGSSPWVPDPSICDPADSMPASVNQP